MTDSKVIINCKYNHLNILSPNLILVSNNNNNKLESLKNSRVFTKIK